MFRCSSLILIVLIAMIASSAVHSQTIWNGPKVTFSKAANADPMLAANQDRITDNVWITRADEKGIYNAVTEEFYEPNSISPADTEWAFRNNNPIGDLTAINWAALTFEPWETAHRGPSDPPNTGPPSTVNQPAVLHLITDDIYLNIMFLEWGGGNSGGFFSYERSTAVPEPACLGVIGVGLLIVSMFQSRPKRSQRV